MKAQPDIKSSTALWRTPLGPMRGEVTPLGLRWLRFPKAAEQSLELARPSTTVAIETWTADPELDPAGAAATEAVLARITEALTAFFAGAPLPEPLPLDERGRPPFDGRVWAAARAIPFGETMTYGQLAARVGHPTAARAVGGALGRNPYVLLVPCHRVVAAATGASRLCGFTGGLELKAWLLNFETLPVAPAV